MNEIDPNGCERCGIVGCPLPAARAADIAAKAAGGEWKATHAACNEAFAVCFQRTPFAVDWREFAARQRDEHVKAVDEFARLTAGWLKSTDAAPVDAWRAMALEAAARVHAAYERGAQHGSSMEWSRQRVATIAAPAADLEDLGDILIDEVLRAFGIVK